MPRSRTIRGAISALAATTLVLGVSGGAHAATGAGSHPVKATPKTTAAGTALTMYQAQAQARKTGKPVIAGAMTTPTAQTVANADGSFTRTSSIDPVRINRGGAWIPLNATLVKNADGSISPTATTAALHLSDGGTAPLAVLDSGGRTLALTLPVRLPVPTLSGATATYTGVLPGVNLVVTADTQGGFSDVVVVTDAAAAADPGLAGLLTASIATTGGLNVHTDADGVIEADTGTGTPVFTAPTPMAWDSATEAAAVPTAAAAAAETHADPANPAITSSSSAAGTGAHRTQLKTAYTGHTLALAVPTTLTAPANGQKPDFPVFIDPSWGPVATDGGVPTWTSVNSYYAGSAYPQSSMGAAGEMQVGYCGDTSDPDPCDPVNVSRSFLTLNTSGVPANATILSNGTAINVLENWSASCTAEGLNLYQTGTISKSTTWNSQPGWDGELGSDTVAHGNNSSCPSAGVGYSGSAVVAAFQSVVGLSTLTVGLRASSETNDMSWKQFDEADTTFSETYDVPPTVSSLTTSPATNCSGGSTVGLGSLTLSAAVDSPVGNNLTTTFALYAAGNSTNLLAAGGDTVPSGNTTATLPVAASILSNAAGTTQTAFTWNASTTDGTLNANSSTCTFTYNPTIPGQPSVAVTSPLPSGDAACTDNTATRVPLGSTCSFAITAPSGTAPTDYDYQLNTDAPVTVTPAASGPTDIAFTVNRQVNTLTVWALGAGGNVGQTASVPFLAAYPATSTVDGDLTGAGLPDLIVPGGTGSLPAGLWYAAGNTDGSVAASSAVNIGTAGLTSAGNASNWTGTQAITGPFCEDNVQDILDYNPSPAGTGGSATILCNDGSADPLSSTSPANGGTAPTVMTGETFNDNSDVAGAQQTNGGNAVELVNAGNTAATNSGTGNVLNDDLLAVMDNDLYLYTANEPGAYTTLDGFYTDVLTATDSPDNTMDWDNWTLATTQINGATDLYLWDKLTGALDLWTGLSAGSATTAFPNATTLNAANHYTLATGWNTGVSNLVLRAGNLDGKPVLWTVNTTTGAVNSYDPNATDTALTSAASNPRTLVTSAHYWQLNNGTTGNVAAGAATDTTSGTALPMSGSSAGATWNTDGLFSPDVLLNGSSGYLNTASSAVNLTQSFTVSAWADPTLLGGTLLSQDGSADSGFTVSPTSGGWSFALNTGAGTGTTYNTISGGTVDLGAWSQITATYNSTTTVMNLYVNGTLVATGNHTAPASGAANDFVVGAALNAGSRAATYFTGQVAEVQTWNQTQAPAQPATPASYQQSVTPTRILDTRGSTGSTLTDGTTTAGDPVGSGSTVTLQISGDSVSGGNYATIPASVTAVAIDLTAVSETNAGFITAYADGTQRPITSSDNYVANTAVTGYQIVPVGADGKIDLYNGGGFNASTQVIVDVTGYFTSDPTLTGDQTYTPLPGGAYRALDTASPLGSGGTLNLQVTGTDAIPSTATAVAVNLTALGSAGGGYLQAYATGAAPANDTSLTYGTNNIASMAGDVPIGTGGQITIANEGTTGGATDVIADISGYYTDTLTGLAYHTTNPTRLVDTRMGIGGSTGAVPGGTAYTISQSSTTSVTTNPGAVLATMLTAASPASSGDAIAYPTGQTQPGTSNLNWVTSQTVANLALTPTNGTGQISVLNQGSGTVQFVVDCSGYFAANSQVPTPAAGHQWKLSEGTGSVFHDSIGGLNGNLSSTGTSWSVNNNRPGVTFDGNSGYAETNGNAVNTAGSYTVSAWVYPTSLPSGNATAVSEFGNDNSPFYLQYNSGSWAFVISNNDTTSPTLNGPNGPYDVVANQWYHITGVYNATTQTAQIYVDGQLVGAMSGLPDFSAAGDLNIGRDLYTGLQVDYFPGEISGVETWNTALSAGQIATLD